MSVARWRLLFSVCTLLVACGNRDHTVATSVAATASASAPLEASADSAPLAPEQAPVLVPSRPDCEKIAVYRAGAPAGFVCDGDADKNGLTVVDLSDTWTPRVFSPDPVTHDASEYRTKYLELAGERFADLGLYGIMPTLSVLFGRLSDDKRIACDAKIDRTAVSDAAVEWSSATDEKAQVAALRKAVKGKALQVAQAELICMGYLKPSNAGAMNETTEIALEMFRRRNMIIGYGLDGDTLSALALGGDELAFRALLRGLRERVADAAGLVEDGSAVEAREPVVDRDLDLARFVPSPRGPLDEGAPDLVDKATDVAARALGWTSFEAAKAFFEREKSVRAMRVAVALPAPPAYHGKAMDLRVEIDRGDVFYETPARAAAEKRKLGSFRGPTFVVFAKDGDHTVALMRWATTIGGWKKERLDDGAMALRYKESDVGERLWRQIIAAPAWLPPESTPETDVLREAADGTFELKKDLIQPGFRNAYGLVMLVHEEPVDRGGKVVWNDYGIRTHGSVDFRSIQRGESHGCHRLYNHLALRLSGFLLQHRETVRRGKMASEFHRTLEWHGQKVELAVPVRGYLFELEPPVPVRVLEGHVAGETQTPMSNSIPIKSAASTKG